MKTVILSIGDEVLEGDVVNSDAAFLSHELIDMGFEILYHKTIGDYADPLISSFNDAYELADIIITTGGLGPTKDDMTKTTIAEALGLGLVFYESIKNEIASWFARSSRSMSDNNLTQCYIPEGATALPNKVGTAPGVYIERDGKTIIMLPGPPRELNPMFLEHVKHRLAKKTKKKFAEKYYMISGVGEAPIEAILRQRVTENEDYMINTYITPSGVMIKATGKGEDEEHAFNVIEKHDAQLKRVIGKYLYAEEKQELWETVCSKLIEQNITISSAESLTGGLFSEYLSRVSGISKVFKGAVTAYSAEAKINVLGVKKETIDKYQTISEQTAREMALGGAKLMNADICAALTGVAGPGAAEGKQPGTVCIAIYYKGETVSETNIFNGDRETVKNRSVARAFHIIWELLKNS